MTIGGPSKFWVLDPEIMKDLQKEFKFDYDPIPFSSGFVAFDGLADAPHDKTSVWLNPLFGRGITQWVRWAVRQRKRGLTVVVILPLDGWVRLFMEEIQPTNDQLWFASLKGENGEIRVLGNHYWINPETGKKRLSSRPSFLFILRPEATASDSAAETKGAGDREK